MKRSQKIIGFEWNESNKNKNWQKHQVSDQECEEVFFDPQKKILKDTLHSFDNEGRYILLGQTKLGRLLFLVFTVRKNKIRVISARDLNKKEKYLYETKT